MQLKSLTLRGFKSFAERTALRFEQGITAIVGPNGSGKSNICDAVIWVLGEQSARSLRSGSMEDVIFAGSSARPALGMAEVSLCLSNTDGILPIEFSEVTITRRLFRSGESDYYINNSPCRLLDIQELLSDTGLGKGLYSIIGQGRLEEILSSKPEDKRLLIEEAAGILKHKKRKERALKKLDSMEQHLQRAKDISQEINRQLKPLRNQANKAQEYIALSNKLRSLEIGIAVMDLKELQNEWEDVVEHEGKLREHLAAQKDELSKKHADYEKLQLEFETKNFFSGDISDKRRKLQSIEEKLISSISLLDEKNKNIEQRIGEIRHNIQQAKQRKNNLIDQQRWLEREKGNLLAEVDKNVKASVELERKISEVHQKRQDIEKKISDLRSKVQAESKVSEDYQIKIGELQLLVQTAENKLSFLKNELGELAKRKVDLQHRIESKKQNFELIGIELARIEFQISELTIVLEQLAKELSEKKNNENELRQEYAAVKARIKALEDVIDSLPTTDDITSSSRVIEEPDVIGLIKDAIEVRPEYERAIEAVLGGDIFCLVLNSSSSFKDLVKEINNMQLGLTSLIANDRAKFRLPNKNLSMATWALDVITYPEEFKYAVSALLSHVYIVSDFSTALTLSEKTDNEIIATVDGEIILPNGKVILGAASEAVGILGYQRELKELVDSLSRLETKIEKEIKDQNEITRRIEKFEAKKNESWSKLQSKKLEQSNLKQSLEDMEPELNKYVLQEEVLLKELNNLEATIKRGSEDILKVKQEHKVQKEKLFSMQFDLDEMMRSRDASLEEESKLKVDLGKLKAGIDSLEERISHNSRRVTSIIKELENFEQEVERENDFLNYLINMQSRIAPLKAAYEQILVAVSFRHDQISEMTSFEEGTLEDIRQALRQSQSDINRLNDQIEAIIKEIHEADVTKAQLELKVTAAVQKIVDEYNVPLEKALEYELGIDREQAENEASNLRRRIAMLGPINPIAVDEYAQLEERYRFFMEQIEDLQKSKRALVKIISAIEQKMRTRFIETFEKVNENFQAVFESLFPGGQAELILTDPDDVQNSGIDIIAQPSGKKLQRLSLLSGGEKSLVALALSFALYQTRPSPFYILDEVEAALDDINLKRFTALLNKIKQDSQVLIITHQRRTMEMADSLYGVSMQADGVSRLISQKFSEVTVGVR